MNGVPLFLNKDYAAPSVFQPEALVREAGRQKAITTPSVPSVCLLDPDGDIVRYLLRQRAARRASAWPCYHSDMHTFSLCGRELGVVGSAVGASYAVLVAEQMFVLGCELLISITSAGQITDVGPPPYFVLIERALRDEGTSHHYLPPSDFAEADPRLISTAKRALDRTGLHFHLGSTWTTDAPFRETIASMESARDREILAVEMEAAALYAFASARAKKVVCLAHVTNRMGTEGDFEKGDFAGAREALAATEALAAIVEKEASEQADG